MQNSFLQYLRAQNVLSEEALNSLEAEFNKGSRSLDDILLEQGKMDPEDLITLKSDFYHIPGISLEKKQVSNDAMTVLPKELTMNYQMIPFEIDGEVLRVAMVNPENLKAREAVDFLARQKGWDTQFYVTTSRSLKHAIEQSTGNLSNQVAEALEYADQPEAPDALKEKRGNFEEVVKSAPVSKMVNVILRHAVEGGASDIHIEPGRDATRVRYRIDGKLHATLTLPKYIHASIVSRIKVLASLKLDETRKPQDGRIHLTLGSHEIDFRVSTLPLMGEEKVVMRILDVTRGAPTFEQLGFMGRNIQVINRTIQAPNGMFLVTGPTGSGKSTTLFAALSVLNEEDVNIVTLEDPVEYYLPGANQSQVRPEVGYTFASGLRSILRQDPDIVMVGEIRDGETAQLAVQAALTGHIVLSTLHTNSASGAVPRLMDMKVEPFLLSSTINVLLAQRLVRKLCQDCKEVYALPPDMQQLADAQFSQIDPAAIYPGIDKAKPLFYRGKGCIKCGQTGYRGRLAISEVIENTRNMRNVIAKGFDQNLLLDELKEQKFIPMMQDGMMKASLGMTTVEEVVLATKE